MKKKRKAFITLATLACVASCLAYLVIQHASLNQSLCVAASKGDTVTVEKLLKQGANPNVVGSIGDTDCDCEDNPSPAPPLTLAIFQTSGNHHEYLETAAALLHAGANINARADSGMTALMWATSPRAVAFLLAHGADPNLKDNHGFTALMHQDGGQAKSIGTLLKAAGATQ